MKLLIQLVLTGSVIVVAAGECITKVGEGIPGNGKACIFPFVWNGIKYDGCPLFSGDPKGEERWCSTKVDSNGTHMEGEGEFGLCPDSDDCPIHEAATENDNCKDEKMKGCIGKFVEVGGCKCMKEYFLDPNACNVTALIPDGCDDCKNKAMRYCATETAEQKYYVDDGCHNETCNKAGKVGDDVVSSYQLTSYEAGVRCCETNENASIICTTPVDFKCPSDNVAFDVADKMCKEKDLRLCTREELLSEICCGTGGKCDNHEVWTSTPEPVDGGWSKWEPWSDCSATCGTGEKQRIRVCSDPPPKYGGALCSADASSHTEAAACNEHLCPIPCEWEKTWTDGVCSEDCGEGTQTKTRKKKTVEANGGLCKGQNTSIDSCFLKECPVHCEWDVWQNGTCPVSCGGGMRADTRKVKTASEHQGNECTGIATRSLTCNLQGCPVNGGWSGYTYATCSKTCGGGSRIGSRTCSNPSPSNGGKACKGSTQTTSYGCASSSCPAPFFRFYEGNYGRQDTVCTVTLYNVFSSKGWMKKQWRCDNDEARSMLLCHASKGTTIRVFDDGDVAYDNPYPGTYSKLVVEKDIVGCVTINSFDSSGSYQNGIVSQTKFGTKTLDGKVSGFSIRMP